MLLLVFETRIHRCRAGETGQGTNVSDLRYVRRGWVGLGKCLFWLWVLLR